MAVRPSSRGSIPTEKERQLHDAIFRKERRDLFAVWDCCQELQQE